MGTQEQNCEKKKNLKKGVFIEDDLTKNDIDGMKKKKSCRRKKEKKGNKKNNNRLGREEAEDEEKRVKICF